MGKELSGKPKLRFKMWSGICCIVYLAVMALPVALTDENNHEYHPIIPKAPDVPAGAYYETISKNNRQVTLYWKKHSNFEHGGNNFSYYIEAFGNNYTKKYYTPLSFLTIDLPLEDIHVSIFAENEEGRSSESNLYIPSVNKKLNMTAFTKHDYNNGSYLLSWADDLETIGRRGYTNSFNIIWCKSEFKNECTDIEYTTINGTERKLVMDLPKGNYQFAISLNNKNNTSGLRWIDCETYEKSSDTYVTLMKDDKKFAKMNYCEMVQAVNEMQFHILTLLRD